MNPAFTALMSNIAAARSEAARILAYDRTADYDTKNAAKAIIRLLSGAAEIASNPDARSGIPSRDWCKALLTRTPEEAVNLFWERRGFKHNGGGIMPAVSAADIEKNLLTAWRELDSLDKNRVSGLCVPIVPYEVV